MKTLLKLIVLTLFLSLNITETKAQKINVVTTSFKLVKGDTINIVKTDTIIKKPCHCDKKVKRQVKKTGEPRTQFGKVLFDVFDVLKKIIPFLH